VVSVGHQQEVVGNFHVHTLNSDGTGTYDQVALAAIRAGLDVVMMTDHNVRPDDLEGWYTHPETRRRMLVLVGEEVHDPLLEPPGNHYLALGVERDVHAYASHPQALIEATTAAGGVGFIAHPVELPAPLIGVPAFPWRDWHVHGFVGIELWNYLSEFKSYMTTRRQALAALLRPDLFIRGPFPQTLALWDRLLGRGKPVVAIGGADAHANVYAWGPLRRRVFPYEAMFRAVNTHLLLDSPLPDDVSEARRQVLHALRRGHAFVANDALGNGRGFRFTATGRCRDASMGDAIVFDGPVTLRATVPLRATLRLLRDGNEMMRVPGRELTCTVHTPGVYRIEACRRHGRRLRGWLYSNPIYITEPRKPAPEAPVG
jgi:hypothetical protein